MEGTLVLLGSRGAPGLCHMHCLLKLGFHSLWIRLVTVPSTHHLGGRTVPWKIGKKDICLPILSRLPPGSTTKLASCPYRGEDDVWLLCGPGIG